MALTTRRVPGMGRRAGWRALLVAAPALTLAACGSSGSSSSGAGTPAPGASAASTTAASGALVSTRQTAIGTVLVDKQSMTLYRFDKDSDGKSACVDKCTVTWPPSLVEGGASVPSSVPGVSGTFGTVSRPEGTKQLALDGRPLYRFSGDQNPGDTKGDGVNGVWHAVKVGGGASSSTSTTKGSTGSSGPGGSSGSSGTSATTTPSSRTTISYP